MEKYRIYADLLKNRLYVSLSGFLTDQEMKTASDLTIQEIKKLKTGFTVINDITNFKPASQAAVDEIKRAQQFAKEKGSGRTIRVVGEASLAAMQFNRSSKDVAGYAADTVATVAEAEKLLDQG